MSIKETIKQKILTSAAGRKLWAKARDQYHLFKAGNEFQVAQKLKEESAVKFIGQNEVEPNLDAPISQICTYQQMQTEVYKRWCRDLNIPARSHRKYWEYVYIMRVLEVENLLKAGVKALGFGVGQEPMIPVFAKRELNCLVTDLEPSAAAEKGWSQTEQHFSLVEQFAEFGTCSVETIKNQINHRFVDMNSIPADLRQGQFDFVWSCCALEHLGSLDAGLRFIESSLESVKPGGLAIHTTEFNVSSTELTVDHEATVLYRKQDIEGLISRLKSRGHEISVNWSTGSHEFDKIYDVPPFHPHLHLKVKLDQYVTSSIGLIIRKAHS